MAELNREYRSYDQSSGDGVAPLRPRSLEAVAPLRGEILDPLSTSVVEKAYSALQAAYVLVAAAAGIDKFFYRLTDWAQYLGSAIPRGLSIDPSTFLYLVGVWEIFLGIGMALRPRIFANVFAFWLGAIVINLLLKGQYFDIALRDIGLAVGAYALARLGEARERSSIP